MVIIKKYAYVMLFVLCCSFAHALDVVPGLKGFGTDTRAAYGNETNPTICIVNTLVEDTAITDSTRNGVAVKLGGLQSFIEYAVDNKIIIFEVSGVIEDFDVWELDDDYVTIAGQTAPPPGISVHGVHLSIGSDATSSNHVLMQHMRWRAGDNPAGKSGSQRNALEVLNNSSYIVLDHNTFSWAPDSNVGTADISYMTFSHNLVSEPLNESIHSKSAHGTALNITNGGDQVAVFYNLLIHAWFRNPNLSGQDNVAKVLAANNLVYNPGYRNFEVEAASAAHEYNIIGNHTIGGADTTTGGESWTPERLKEPQHASTEIFIDDNRIETKLGAVDTQDDETDWDKVKYEGTVNPDNKVTVLAFALPTGFTPMDVDDVKAYVLANVGAWPADRDDPDQHMIDDATNGTGTNIDVIEYTNDDCTGWQEGPGQIDLACCTGEGTGTCIQNEDAGWPTLAENVRNVETIGFPSDPHSDDDVDGYTNLEEWVHGLAGVLERRDQIRGMVFK